MCSSLDLKVLETRRDDEWVWRRRRCGKCKEDMVTQERALPGLKIPKHLQELRRLKREDTK